MKAEEIKKMLKTGKAQSGPMAGHDVPPVLMALLRQAADTVEGGSGRHAADLYPMTGRDLDAIDDDAAAWQVGTDAGARAVLKEAANLARSWAKSIEGDIE